MMIFSSLEVSLTTFSAGAVLSGLTIALMAYFLMQRISSSTLLMALFCGVSVAFFSSLLSFRCSFFDWRIIFWALLLNGLFAMVISACEQPPRIVVIRKRERE